MRLPNFHDRRIRYKSFLLKNVVTNKIKILKLFNFFKMDVGERVVFYYIKRYQTTSPQQTLRHIVPIKR